MNSILIVDDEAVITSHLEEVLTSMGYEVIGMADSGKRGLALAEELKPDLVLMDIIMPGEMDGIDAGDAIQKRLGIPVIFVSAYADDSHLFRARSVHPYGYIVKPYQDHQIRAAVEVALHKRDEEHQVQELLARYRDRIRISELLSAVLEDSPFGMMVVDTGGEIIYINRRAAALTGYSREDAPTLRDWCELAFPDRTHRKSALNAFTSGESEPQRHLLRTGGGEDLTMEFRTSALMDGSAVVSMLDVTEATRSADRLRESESMYRLLTDNVADVILCFDRDFNRTYVSPSVRRLLGYSPEEIMEMEFLATLDSTSADKLRRRIDERKEAERQGRRDTEPSRYEVRMIHKDGSSLWAEIVASPMHDDSGRFTGIVAVVRDISQRKAVEQSLANTRQQFLAVLDNMQAVVYVADLRTDEVLFANKYLREKLGHDPVGQTSYDALQPGLSGPNDECDNFRLVDPGHAEAGLFVWEFKWPALSGWFLAQEQAMLWTDQNWVRLEIAFDITDRKLMEKELERAKKQAEQANTAKSQFLANMSHEIRTPMNAIIGFSSMMKEQETEEPRRRQAEMIKVAGESLLTIINDILDYSKIEAGRLELEHRPFQLRRLLTSLLDECRVLASQKNLDLRLEIADDAPALIVSDAVRLRQILHNFLSNAVKFTERGHVLLRVESGENPEPGKLDLTFHVEDTGIGIPDDKLSDIFERFTQLDSSLTKQYAGTGLGLAISRKLAEMLGGEIRAESVMGEGSTFSFRAVFETAEETGSSLNEATEHDGDQSTRSLKILLAEDDRINEAYATSVLEEHGHRVRVARNGRQVLAALSEEDADVVLMDVQMPVMDGLEATRRIRAGGVPGRENVVIIGLSAYAMKGDRERFTEAGMDDYITKPVEPETLMSVLQATSRELQTLEETTPSCIRRDDLLRRFRNSPNLLREIVEEYLKTAPERLASMRRALAAADAQEFLHAAHSLRGISATITAGEVERLAARCEKMNPTEDTGAGELVVELEQAIARADSALRELLETELA